MPSPGRETVRRVVVAYDRAVWRAGEHTCELGTSTVDSAWHSGLREASRLLGEPVSLP